MSNIIPPEHFKAYVPNVNTKLGRAYLCAVKDCEGNLLATEANYLRENPLLWLRAVSLYANNLDFLIRQAKTRLAALKPVMGDAPSAVYNQAIRDHKAWSVAQEHKLQKIRTRRAELIMELGYTDIREAMVVGDAVDCLADVLAALKQEDWIEAGNVVRHLITRLTHLSCEPDDEPDELSTLQDLLSKVRKGRNADQD